VRGVGDGPPLNDSSLPPGQLYNIAEDFAEKNNLYEKHPEIVKRLSALLDQYLGEGRSTPGKRVEPLPDERAGNRGARNRGGVEYRTNRSPAVALLPPMQPICEPRPQRSGRADYASYTQAPPTIVRSIGIVTIVDGSSFFGSRPSTTRSASLP